MGKARATKYNQDRGLLGATPKELGDRKGRASTACQWVRSQGRRGRSGTHLSHGPRIVELQTRLSDRRL